MNTILACSVLLQAVLFSNAANTTVMCYSCRMVKGNTKDESCADSFSGGTTKTCDGSSCHKITTVSGSNMAISRGCWVNGEEGCYTKETYADRKVTICACTGNMCNAAMTLFVTSLVSLSLAFLSFGTVYLQCE